MILVGDARPRDDLDRATAAETGHLVFGTLHTQSAPSTIDRIIDVFAPEQQEQVRIMIANSLQAVVTQALLPTSDGVGRIAALEILLPDDAVRNLIRQAKIEQVYSVMQTKTSGGMQTMEQALADLVIRQVVNVDDALSRSSRPEQLTGLLERQGYDVAGALTALEGHKPAPPPQQAAPVIQAAPEPDAVPGLRMAELTMSDSIWKPTSFSRKPKESRRRRLTSSPMALVDVTDAAQLKPSADVGEAVVLKKDISFSRKPKAPKEPTVSDDAQAEQPSLPPTSEKQQSFLKKEISFSRKPKAPKEPAETEAAEQPSLPPTSEKQQSFLKKEISFSRKKRDTEVDRLVHEATQSLSPSFAPEQPASSETLPTALAESADVAMAQADLAAEAQAQAEAQARADAEAQAQAQAAARAQAEMAAQAEAAAQAELAAQATEAGGIGAGHIWLLGSGRILSCL